MEKLKYKTAKQVRTIEFETLKRQVVLMDIRKKVLSFLYDQTVCVKLYLTKTKFEENSTFWS